MKRIKYVILFFTLMLFVDINVIAATDDGLEKLDILTDGNSKICVYKTKDDKAYNNYGLPMDDYYQYIVIGINENPESDTSRYSITDYTLDYNINPGVSPDKTKHSFAVNGETQANNMYANSDNCDDYYAYIFQNQNDGYGTVHIISKGRSPQHDFVDEKAKYTYTYEKTITVEENIEIVEGSFSKCKWTYDGNELKLANYFKGDDVGYFITTYNNKFACPATTKQQDGFYTRVNIDLANFNDCSKWKLERNPWSDRDTTCFFYLIPNEEDGLGYESNIGSGTTGIKEGHLVTTYKEYNNTMAPTIRIIEYDQGSYSAKLENGKELELSSDFIKENIDGKEKYPKYLLKLTNGTYEFSETKKEDAVEVYINIDSLMEFNLNGTDIKATCNDLIGNDLIKLVNNNVLKIVYIAVPIILILLTSFDFAKVVFIDDKEGIQKAGKKFLKRVIVSVFIYLIPQILILVINTIGAKDVDQCIKQLNQMQQEISEES